MRSMREWRICVLLFGLAVLIAMPAFTAPKAESDKTVTEGRAKIQKILMWSELVAEKEKSGKPLVPASMEEYAEKRVKVTFAGEPSQGSMHANRLRFDNLKLIDIQILTGPAPAK